MIWWRHWEMRVWLPCNYPFFQSRTYFPQITRLKFVNHQPQRLEMKVSRYKPPFSVMLKKRLLDRDLCHFSENFEVHPGLMRHPLWHWRRLLDHKMKTYFGVSFFVSQTANCGRCSAFQSNWNVRPQWCVASMEKRKNGVQRPGTWKRDWCTVWKKYHILIPTNVVS